MSGAANFVVGGQGPLGVVYSCLGLAGLSKQGVRLGGSFPDLPNMHQVIQMHNPGKTPL